MHSPSVSDWLTAVGTVGAFAVALILFALSQRDGRMMQAGKITAWLDPEDPLLSGDENGRLEHYFRVWLMNASTECIYMCKIDILLANPGQQLIKTQPSVRVLSVVPPTTQGPIAVTANVPVDAPIEGLTMRLVRLTFWDSANRYWQRDYMGRLTRWGPDGVLTRAARIARTWPKRTRKWLIGDRHALDYFGDLPNH